MPNDSKERLFCVRFVTVRNEEEVGSNLQHFRYLCKTTNANRFPRTFDFSKIVRTELSLHRKSFLTELQFLAIATNIVTNDFIKIHSANLRA